jgi:hypothetical protein
MVWKPGQSGNLNGRPRKYPRPAESADAPHHYEFFKAAALRDEYRFLAEQQDLEDPILFQHKLLSDESIPKVARSMIANQIAPYYRPRLGVMERNMSRPPSRFLHSPPSRMQKLSYFSSLSVSPPRS